MELQRVVICAWRCVHINSINSPSSPVFGGRKVFRTFGAKHRLPRLDLASVCRRSELKNSSIYHDFLTRLPYGPLKFMCIILPPRRQVALPPSRPRRNSATAGCGAAIALGSGHKVFFFVFEQAFNLGPSHLRSTLRCLVCRNKICSENKLPLLFLLHFVLSEIIDAHSPFMEGPFCHFVLIARS